MAVRATWAALVLGLVVVAAGTACAIAAGHVPAAVVNLPAWAAYTVTGVLALTLRPHNRAARRLAVLGSAIGAVAGSAEVLALLHDVRAPASWQLAALLAYEATNWLSFVVAVALCAVFPDGIYQREYERRVVRGLVLTLAPLLLVWVLGSPRIADSNVAWTVIDLGNPAYQSWMRGLGARAGAVLSVPPLMVLVGLGLLGLRYRRFGAEERRQTRWPLFGIGVTAALFICLVALPLPASAPYQYVYAALVLAVALAFPASLVIGIVRHRLLDIDLVIRRSLVFGVLWLVIAAGYVGVAAALGVAAGARLPVGVAVVLTIVATLVFLPARRRLERLADRVVFGRRVSGYQLITEVGGRLEALPPPDEVAETLARAVRDGLGARWVRVGLEHGGRTTLGETGSRRPGEADARLSAPLVHAGSAVGVIECGPKLDGGYTSADEELLTTLGRQAGMAIRNWQLAEEVSRRLEELTASRARLVEAEERARRQLERDLHDGVQQELVALLARLGLASSQLRKDPDAAGATLREAQVDARRALESLQELARGIHPPILADRGLVAAVEERASRMTLPVEVVTEGVARDVRLPSAIEGAAYFFVAEGLANVLKHARASRAWIRLRRCAGAPLQVEVEDDGRGFDPSTAAGSGLRGLQDRLEALDGRLEVGRGPLGGALLRAFLPVEEGR